MFDKNSFLGTQTDQAGSTEYTPIPETEEGYPAVIEKIDARQDMINNEVATMIDVTWLLSDLDGSLELATGLKKNTVRQTFFVDLTPVGGLDMGKGKNVALNKLRDMFGQNVTGKPWAPNMLVGQTARVKVKQTMSQKGDGKIYTNVGSVERM